MQKFIAVFVLVCTFWACEKRDHESSEPRYVVLTSIVRILPTKYYKGTEQKDVYSYNSSGYENGNVFYIDGKKEEERKNYRHDEEGRVLHWESFLADGSEGLTFDYTYSASGKVLTEAKISPAREVGGIKIEEKHSFKEYAYDRYDREISVISQLNGEPFSKYINYRYDKMGNLLQLDHVDNDEKLMMRYEATYNKKGKKETGIVTSYLLSEGQRNVSEYFYDSSGNLIQVKNYLNEKYTSELKDYEYDEAGNCLSCKAYDITGVVTTEYYHTYQRFD